MNNFDHRELQRYMDTLVNNKTKKSSIWKLSELYEAVGSISGNDVDLLKNKYYLQFHSVVDKLVSDGYIKPYGTKKTNRNPFLYERYKADFVAETFTEDEIINKLSLNKLNLSYYEKRVSEFREDYAILVALNNILKNKGLYKELSLNELSYEIFSREKEMIEDGIAAKVMRKIKLKESDIGCRIKNEPLLNTIYEKFYTKATRNILVVENLETYLTLNKYLRSNPVCMDIDMLVYGQGYSSNKNFNGIIEYGVTTKDTILYYGDIDLSGIDIYNNFKNRFKQYTIQPCVQLYTKLLESGILKGVQKSKSQNQRDIEEKNMEEFLSHFSDSDKNKIFKIVKERYYIPQECLNYSKLMGV